VRVVDNKFPALRASEGELGAEAIDAPWPYEATTGFGGHEVIVESPVHGVGMADYAPEHVRLLVDAYVSRLRYWRRDGRVMQALLFRNWGRAAGASLAHAHTQLVALPRAPEAIIREMGNMTGHAARGEGCLLCDMMAADDRGDRVVYDDGVTVVHSPYAAATPYALRIAPRRCASTFEDAASDELESLARALSVVARALGSALTDPAYNLFVHVAPYRISDLAGVAFHWHADVVPRTHAAAGYELGSGWSINVVDPDEAARTLRSAVDVLESDT
jgi:UDPglucose--hexose-1-phosphate uridylyltransferase